MKTQKVFRKKRTVRKKRSSKKKRTSKRIMIGGRAMTADERNYLKNLVFEIGPPPERRDGDGGKEEPPSTGETMTFSREIRDWIDTCNGDKYQVDMLLSINNFGENLQELRRNYRNGFIPYFNDPRRGKSTRGLLLGLSGFFTGQSSGPSDRHFGIKPPDYNPGWGNDDSDPYNGRRG